MEVGSRQLGGQPLEVGSHLGGWDSFSSGNEHAPSWSENYSQEATSAPPAGNPWGGNPARMSSGGYLNDSFAPNPRQANDSFAPNPRQAENGASGWKSTDTWSQSQQGLSNESMDNWSQQQAPPPQPPTDSWNTGQWGSDPMYPSSQVSQFNSQPSQSFSDSSYNSSQPSQSFSDPSYNSAPGSSQPWQQPQYDSAQQQAPGGWLNIPFGSSGQVNGSAEMPWGMENRGPVQGSHSIGRHEAPARECVLCQDAPREAALFPCGHKCVCLTCAKLLQANGDPCPICRMEIQGHACVLDC